MVYSSSRFEASILAMEKYFPNFSLNISNNSSGPEARWRGAVQPIQTTNHLEELLDDIAVERLFYIQQGGIVFHHPNCKESHQNHNWSEKITNPGITFDLEVNYGGGMNHPKAFVLSPLIPSRKRKHMNFDGSICAYAPWRDAWNWKRDTVVDFMGLVLGWLIKWIVWDQTEIWIGEEVSHNTLYLLQAIRPDKQCWCSSGKMYKRCHQKSDELNARSLVRRLRR